MEAIRQGKLSPHAAEKISKLPKDKQVEALTAPKRSPDAVKLQRKIARVQIPVVEAVKRAIEIIDSIPRLIDRDSTYGYLERIHKHLTKKMANYESSK